MDVILSIMEMIIGRYDTMNVSNIRPIHLMESFNLLNTLLGAKNTRNQNYSAVSILRMGMMCKGGITSMPGYGR